MALGGRTDILPGGHHGRATVLARLGLSFPEPEAERCEQQGAGGRPVRASAGRPPNATVTPTCQDESTTAPKRPTATRNSAPTETTVSLPTRSANQPESGEGANVPSAWMPTMSAASDELAGPRETRAR